jgi:hypothetical protein
MDPQSRCVFLYNDSSLRFRVCPQVFSHSATTSFGSRERAAGGDGNSREKLFQETPQRQRATDRNRPNQQFADDGDWV